MKFNRTWLMIALVIVAGIALNGCSLSETGETIAEGRDNASSPVAKAVGGVVATVTGVPLAAPLVSFLVGLGMALVERKRRKKTEVVAGVMAGAIETSKDKDAIAHAVTVGSASAGVSETTARVVANATE